GVARMRAGLHRELLGGQAEGVVAERVQHVAAAHAVVAGEDVGGDVAERVADVQADTGRVGEHVLDEQLVGRGLTGQRAGRVRRLERSALPPALLPSALQAPRERRVVPMLGYIAFGCTRVLHDPAFSCAPSYWTESANRVERAPEETGRRAVRPLR